MQTVYTISKHNTDIHIIIARPDNFISIKSCAC